MTTKVCTACGVEKEFILFSKAPHGSLGRQAICKDCVRKRDAKIYRENKEKIDSRNREARKRTLQEVDEIKAKSVCKDCGKNYPPPAMEFHHPDPSIKDLEVSVLVHYNSMKRVLEEIDKCIILCSNCHRIRHWVEKQRLVSATG